MLYSADNDGIANNGSVSTKRLKNILIKDANTSKPLKSFSFNYGYFSYDTQGGSFVTNSAYYDRLGKRLKLSSVQENGYNEFAIAQPLSPHSFFYEESIIMPLKTSFARDFWGYYNGKNNNTMLPNLSYYLYSGYPEYQNIPLYVLSSYGNGANRSVNANTVQAGILKKIVYPTKGYTTFDYESNTFTNYNYPDIDQITASTNTGNVEDKNNTNDVRSKQFSIPNSLVVHFTASINRGPNTNLTFTDLLPSTITLTRIGAGGSNITPIKTWQMQSTQAYSQDFNVDGMVTWTEDIALEYVPNSYYVLVANLPDALGVQNTSTNSASVSGQYNFTYMINTTAKLSKGAGLRIKSIKNYESDGTLLTQKNIEYLSAGTSSGILMSPLKHFYSREMSFSRLYNTPGTDLHPEGMIFAYNITKNIWFVSADSFVPFSDATQGNLVGYSTVKEIDFGSSNNGAKIFNYFNVESNSKTNNPSIPYLRNGLLASEEVRNASDQVLKKVEYTYEEKEAKFLRGFKVFTNFYGSEQPLLGDPGYGHVYYPPGKRYTIDSYPNNAQWLVMNKKKEFLYNNNNVITNEQNFTYNTLGQLVSTKTYNSKSQEVISLSKYPIDETATIPIVEVMKANSLYNNLLEAKTIINGNITSIVRNNYDLYTIAPFTSSQVLLKSTETSTMGGAFKEDVKFNNYGDFKAPLTFTQNGISTTILWSYNSLFPVAKIENADYSTIISILGDANLYSFMRNPNPSDTDINNFIAPLRSSPSLKLALITSYTYDQIAGILSETDPSGKRTTYEYDFFNRLKFVKDQNGNIIKSYTYNYRP